MKRPVMARVGGRQIPVLVKVKGGYRYATPAEAGRAKTGKMFGCNPPRPLRRYPRKLASKLIRQEIPRRPRKQAIAIGIARARAIAAAAKAKAVRLARRATKRNPLGLDKRPDYISPRDWKRLAVYEAQSRRLRRYEAGAPRLRSGGLRRTPSAAYAKITGLGDAFRRRYRVRGKNPTKARKRNPQWLTGAMPRKIESGQHMTRFYDAGKRLKAEMFESGTEAPKLLVHNPPKTFRFSDDDEPSYTRTETELRAMVGSDDPGWNAFLNTAKRGESLETKGGTWTRITARLRKPKTKRRRRRAR